MCSRFENKDTGEMLYKKLEKDFSFPNCPQENLKQESIAPTDDILIITKFNDSFYLNLATWGFKFDSAKSPLIFNSRIETIQSKPYWKKIFDANRCLIPATAFYEWENHDKIKIPKRISFKEYDTFFIGGIYIIKDNHYFVSLITTDANSAIAKIHNRMPVIYNHQDGKKFLDYSCPDALELCNYISSNNDTITTEINLAETLLTAKQKDYLANNQNT